MSQHHKISLRLGLAAILVAMPALAAPPPRVPFTVSHNEQGDLNTAPPTELAVADDPPPPPPPAPCLADADGNGVVNSTDVSAFMTTWLRSIQAGTLEADIDGSGEVTSADIPAFLNVWTGSIATGC